MFIYEVEHVFGFYIDLWTEVLYLKYTTLGIYSSSSFLEICSGISSKLLYHPTNGKLLLRPFPKMQRNLSMQNFWTLRGDKGKCSSIGT